jgi:hypothetical protein
VTSQFVLSATQITIAGVTCNVFSFISIIAFAGAMNLKVTL